MSKKGFLGLILAVGIPVLSYYIVKWSSEGSVEMPRRYFFDTVTEKTVKGKLVKDTVWHKVANFTFTNQLGKTVSVDSLKGKILVVDYFFTRCPNPCPTLTRNMKKMQDAFLKTDSLVHFISLTVDPPRDSVEALKRYADKYKVRHNNWWFLTGDKKAIYDLAYNEFKAATIDGGEVDTAFLHTNKFYLLDKDRVIRGWYDGTDTVAMAKLAKDIGLLFLEKDKKKKRNLFRK
ncbi:protein SCO1/2 [Lacibacter cauensis]|uniref:Protein SCO1/2 n=1 Tax=Lacibacter cauensis TaxID=510947 RepID=A0A562SQR1_9BACT|nr:SCO family protein [Lacibacter cauensis]TWI83110.1 protein SCO1/2 [Lacibacter cauensis]